jgi:hypothetical protein
VIEGNIGRRCGQGGACGGAWSSNLRQNKKEDKINVGHKRPPMDIRTLNNQPKTGSRDGRWYGGETQMEGSLGGMLIHRVDGDRVGRVIKTKIIVEFCN